MLNKQLKRRILKLPAVYFYVLCIVLLGAPQLAQSQQIVDSTGVDGILKVGPYLQAPFDHGITVRWVTNQPCYSYVMYGFSEDSLTNKVHSVKNGMVEANNRINAIRLTGLDADKEYFYKIISTVIDEFRPNKVVYGEKYESPIYSFKIKDEKSEELNFSIFNDIQGRPESFEFLLNFQGDQKKDFYVLNGDMYRFLTDEDQMVEGMFKPVSNLFAYESPFILVRGNHELRGTFSRQFMEFFDGKDDRFYYSFKMGDTYFIVLDSGEDKPDKAEVYGGLVKSDDYRIEQAEWLKKEIQKPEFKQSKYKIVFSHIPPFYSNDWHGTTHLKELWVPILNEGKIDLFLSGHTHTYGMHPAVPGEHEFPIVIGGGLKDDKRTIINITINKDRLQLEMFNDSGEMVGKLKL